MKPRPDAPAPAALPASAPGPRPIEPPALIESCPAQRIPQGSLTDLAVQINAEHRQAEQAINTGLQHARHAGELLLQAKGLCDHGQWLPWLLKNFDGSARTARAYMLVVERWPQIEAKWQRVANLSFRDALRLVAEGVDTTEILREAITTMREAIALQAKEIKDESLPLTYWAEQKRVAEEALQYAQSYTLEAERRMGELLLTRHVGDQAEPRGNGYE